MVSLPIRSPGGDRRTLEDDRPQRPRGCSATRRCFPGSGLRRAAVAKARRRMALGDGPGAALKDVDQERPGPQAEGDEHAQHAEEGDQGEDGDHQQADGDDADPAP